MEIFRHMLPFNSSTETAHPSRATKTLENLRAIITIHSFMASLAADIPGGNLPVSCFHH